MPRAPLTIHMPAWTKKPPWHGCCASNSAPFAISDHDRADSTKAVAACHGGGHCRYAQDRGKLLSVSTLSFDSKLWPTPRFRTVSPHNFAELEVWKLVA